MRAIVVAIASLGACLANSPCFAEGFSFEMAAPKIKISVPSIPQMKMGPHPLQDKIPHARHLGTEGPYTVSVLTPTGDPGMTAAECASSMVRDLRTRPNSGPITAISTARINNNTYIAMYFAREASSVRLNAHLFSAAGGTHCVEVHISKYPSERADGRPWLDGFGGANIESF